jgi:hypothetical protein
MRALILYQLLSMLALAQGEESPIPELIEKLSKTEELGFGYSAMFSGSQFLPRRDSAQWNTGVLGSAPPKESESMMLIVKSGAQAIPFLIKHLDDKTPTKVKPVTGMMWMRWNDEYDYNRRTHTEPPKGVNRDSFGEDHHPNQHQITVGDLCFVALGQIVNRSFSATRYQPTGGLIVNSPTYSEALLNAVRHDYSRMTEKEHRIQLVDDFTRPDHESRRNGAAMRLAFYYPEILDDLVIKQLTAPTYNVFYAEEFVRKVLYPEKSRNKRVLLFHDYQTKHGAASKDGVLLQLFDDLDTQIADEEGRLHPPSNPKHDARNALVQLYGYKNTVLPKDIPYVNSWSETEQARLIEALGSVTSPAILKAVRRVFSSIKDDDYLALACFKVLHGKGFDEALIAYCKRRIGKSEYEDDELRAALKALTKPKDNKAEQGGADQPATAPELKSEGKDKPQPESKVAPR